MKDVIVAHDPHGHTAATRTHVAVAVPRQLAKLSPGDDGRLERARRLLVMMSGVILAALLIPATRSYALDTLAYALAIASYGGLVFVTESVCIILIQRCAGIMRRSRESSNGR